ncbi:MAG: hypothetical protein E6G41_15930 [Actinobacteria bacterium]|nr:MAG: hypothetical protein E6G41_15930 [Actinomycetota bacterium]
MRRRSSLPAALAVAALFAAGCGASSSSDEHTVTMDKAAAAAVAHAEAVAEGAEGNGYDVLAHKGRQSTQNGYERLKRERCKRLHPNAPCRVKHVKLLNR